MILFLTALLFLALQDDEPAPPPRPTGSVQGYVSVERSTEGVEGADIVLAGGGTVVRGTTDGSGYFRFDKLPLGEYRLEVRRTGYFNRAQPDSSTRSVSGSTVVSLSDLAPTLSFELAKCGEIVGRIMDSSGRGLSGRSVDIFRVNEQPSAKPVLDFVAQAVTLADGYGGDYRVSGLLPGDYFVRAGGGAGASDRRPKVFFPGVADLLNATPVAVREGRSSTVDIRLPDAATYKISGTATVGSAVFPDAEVTFEISPSNALDAVAAEPFPVRLQNGKFEFTGLPPGQYDVAAWSIRPSEFVLGVESGVSGRISVAIDDRDLDGLVLPFQALVRSMPGRLVVQDGGALGRVGIGLQVKGRSQSLIFAVAFGSSGRMEPLLIRSAEPNFFPVDAAGSFVLPNVSAANRYDVLLQNAPQGAYIADVRQSGGSVWKDGWLPGPGTDPLEVLIRLDGGIVRGVVASPVPVTVVLVPRGREVAGSYRTVVATAGGAFVFDGVAPGEYSVFALERFFPGSPRSADFLSRYAGRGRDITVAPSEQVEIDLDYVPAEPALVP